MTELSGMLMTFSGSTCNVCILNGILLDVFGVLYSLAALPSQGIICFNSMISFSCTVLIKLQEKLKDCVALKLCGIVVQSCTEFPLTLKYRHN